MVSYIKERRAIRIKISVLILVVMDNGLVLDLYKTLLIINKLKNFTKQISTFLNRKLTIS